MEVTEAGSQGGFRLVISRKCTCAAHRPSYCGAGGKCWENIKLDLGNIHIYKYTNMQICKYSPISNTYLTLSATTNV